MYSRAQLPAPFCKKMALNLSPEEQQAVRDLARLAKASTLKDFAMAETELDLYFCERSLMLSLALRNQKVLQACLASVEHGCRLFLAQQDWARGNAETAPEPFLDTLRELFDCIDYYLCVEQLTQQQLQVLMSASTGAQSELGILQAITAKVRQAVLCSQCLLCATFATCKPTSTDLCLQQFGLDQFRNSDLNSDLSNC